MIDSSSSGDGGKRKLSVLDREKRIRAFFNHYEDADGGLYWWPLFWIESNKVFSGDELTPEDIKEFPPLRDEQRECYFFFSIADYHVNGDAHISDVQRCVIPEQALSVMVDEGILPQNFTTDDVFSFLAERAALAGWGSLEFLAKEDDVPLGVPIWWDKYLKLPDVNSINPVQICAFLIAAKMLPKKFGELDFLRFVLERTFISAAISPSTFGSVDKPLVWKMTPEGIAAAEQMGLLDAQHEAIDSSKVDITQGAGAGVPMEPASSSKGDVKRDTSGYYSPSDLMRRHDIPDRRQNAFKQMMKVWRTNNLLSPDIIEHDAKSKNTATFLFRESAGAIQDIIEKYKK